LAGRAIYGILNFGTFSDEQAELLRRLGAAQEVQIITNYVQSYVLKRLMELSKLQCSNNRSSGES
jgi:hypothetical protein